MENNGLELVHNCPGKQRVRITKSPLCVFYAFQPSLSIYTLTVRFLLHGS
jgi:hypothetical protein